MLAILAALAAPTGERSEALQAAAAECPSVDDKSLFMDFLESGIADPSVVTPYGRSEAGGCKCRFCDDELIAQIHFPHTVDPTGQEDVSPCLSTQPDSALRVPHAVAASNGESCEGNTGLDVDTALATITDCVTPDRSGTGGLPVPTIYVMGDSKSSNVRAAIALAVKGAYQVRGFGLLGVGLVLGSDSITVGNVPAKELEAWQKMSAHAWETVASTMQPGDAVVLMERHGSLAPHDPPFAGGESMPTMETYLDESIVKGIVQAKGRFIYLSDWMPVLVDGELKGETEHDWYKRKLEAGYMPAKELVGRVLAKYESAFFADLYGMFCDGVLPADSAGLDDPANAGLYTCTRNIPGTELYAFQTESDDHVNANGAIYLWSHMCDIMQAVGVL